MASFFSEFSDFFMGIFSDPESRRLKKELKDIHETLGSCRPPLFNKATQTVLPGFAQSYFLLYQNLLPLFDLFSKTLNSPDKRQRDQSLAFLVESSFIGDIPARRQALVYEALSSRLSSATNASQESSRVTNEFNAIVADIKKQNQSLINQDVRALFQLKNLVLHSFAGIFKKFGYDLAYFGKANPQFKPCMGDDILPELLDLYYVLGNLTVSPSLEKSLFLLLERISAAKATENEKKMAKLLQKIQNLLTGPCSPLMLLSLIRSLRQEPQFLPDVVKGDENFVQQYVTELSDKFTKDRDRALREVNEGSITKDVAALFGDANHLLDFENYNEATNEKLIAAGLPPLTRIKALRILKSYAQAVLHNGLLDALKAVIVDAFFQDKDFGTKLSTVYYNAENVLIRVAAFDANLVSEGKTTLSALEKYLKGKGQGSSVASKIVEAIDRQALELLEGEAQVIAQMAIKISEILTDYKSPQPKNITNIKGLGGKNNRAIITGLIEGYNKSAQFLKLMKNFVVIRGFGS